MAMASEPRPLVKPVDVLRHQGEAVAALRHHPSQPSEGMMRGVGLGLSGAAATPVVEAVHQRGIAPKRLRRRQRAGIVLLPQPAGVAEGAQAALGGGTGAGEDEKVHRRPCRVRPAE